MKTLGLTLRILYPFVMLVILTGCGIDEIDDFFSGTYLSNSDSSSPIDNPQTEELPLDGIDEGEDILEPTGYSNLEEQIEVTSTGQKIIVNFDLDGMRRNFIVYVPNSANGSSPVVYMFHGTSGSGEKFYNISGWVQKADETGLIAIFPSALTYCFKEDDDMDLQFELPEELVVTTKWNEGNLINPRRSMCTQEEIDQYVSADVASTISSLELVDDVRFMDETLSYVKQTYSVDESHFYISGFSNGANFTARLSVERSSSFAAFAVHGAGKARTETPAVNPATMIMTMGENDQKFLERTGISPLRDDYDLLSFPLDETVMTVYPLNTMVWANLFAHSLDANVYTTSEEFVEGKKMFTYLYDQSLISADNELTFTIMEGVAHFYPNGDERSPFVMADILWEKFENIQN